MSWNLLFSLDVFAILLFAVSYYRNCYRKGYRIDIWHANLFLICIFPNMVMLPFARSELNGIILGQSFGAVVAVIPTVFLLALLGYFSMLAGGSLWRLQIGLGVRKTVIGVMDIVPRCSMMLMSSSGVLIFQALLCLLLQVCILSVYFSKSGFGFDLREFTFANPTFRPIALLVSGYSIVIASHCLARYIDKKNFILLACTLLLSLGLVFFGARSSIFTIYINILLCYLVRLRTRISLIRLISIISVLVVGGLYLGNVRSGQYSIGAFFAVLANAIFFGNTFSDLRDFGWVYATWDHQYWIGKTYLAALAAFVPRFASEFRDTWGLGVVTATTAGFDPHVHPGLRPGAFGEGFFNFGILGVVAIGAILGVIIRRVDIEVKNALASSHPSMMKAFASTMLLGVVGNIAVSAGFSGIYLLVGIYLFSWFCIQLVSLLKVRNVSAQAAS